MRGNRVLIVMTVSSALSFACTGGRGADGKNGSNCTVTKSGDATIIACDDGTKQTVSNGVAGPAGKNGADGEDGATGRDGTNGSNGQVSLINLTTEPASDNCPSTGTRIESGLDENDNGALDADEVEAVKYVCNGLAGTDGTNGTNGKTTLVRTTAEPASADCISGSVSIQVGLDQNNNSTLDPQEITQTQDLCKLTCTVTEERIIVRATVHANLEYASDTTIDDALVYAKTTESPAADVVGWLGFALGELPRNSVYLDATLHLLPSVGGTNPDGNPTVRVTRNDVNAFTETAVTATNMQKGSLVASDATSFVQNEWKEIPLNLSPESLSIDLADGFLSLGLDEIGTAPQSVTFYGPDEADKEPYIEFHLVTCVLPP